MEAIHVTLEFPDEPSYTAQKIKAFLNRYNVGCNEVRIHPVPLRKCIHAKCMFDTADHANWVRSLMETGVIVILGRVIKVVLDEEFQPNDQEPLEDQNLDGDESELVQGLQRSGRGQQPPMAAENSEWRTQIIEKVESIEKSLQALKADILQNVPTRNTRD